MKNEVRKEMHLWNDRKKTREKTNNRSNEEESADMWCGRKKLKVKSTRESLPSETANCAIVERHQHVHLVLCSIFPHNVAYRILATLSLLVIDSLLFSEKNTSNVSHTRYSLLVSGGDDHPNEGLGDTASDDVHSLGNSVQQRAHILSPLTPGNINMYGPRVTSALRNFTPSTQAISASRMPAAWPCLDGVHTLPSNSIPFLSPCLWRTTPTHSHMKHLLIRALTPVDPKSHHLAHT
jgi:hypothetical protein